MKLGAFFQPLLWASDLNQFFPLCSSSNEFD